LVESALPQVSDHRQLEQLAAVAIRNGRTTSLLREAFENFSLKDEATRAGVAPPKPMDVLPISSVNKASLPPTDCEQFMTKLQIHRINRGVGDLPD
jgi:hypothetical protein